MGLSMNPTVDPLEACALRFHQLREDGLYQPVPFAFVSAEMCQQMQHERLRLLEQLPSVLHPQQHRLFAGYNPHAWFDAFQGLLQRFAGTDSRKPNPAC